jgi:molybdate transport system regulatory protein
MKCDIRIEAVLYISCGGAIIGGKGLVESLKAIEEAGSIRAAAEKLGINYRRLWTRIKHAENILGAHLVETDRKGSKLTPLARRIITAYELMEHILKKHGIKSFNITDAECEA